MKTINNKRSTSNPGDCCVAAVFVEVVTKLKAEIYISTLIAYIVRIVRASPEYGEREPGWIR